jgi:5'-methylthioadenosine phosphorylase
MQECLYIHPDNVAQSRRELNLKIAVIARPDTFMQMGGSKQLIVETELGIHTRCYLAEHKSIPFLIVYGRFGRTRSTARDIDFELTQEALSFLGIEYVVGTFVTGSIEEQAVAGSVYVPHDFVGMGGFNQSRNKQNGFRNVDMFAPFCTELRSCLVSSGLEMPFEVSPEGVYVSFHGYPRIETAAELDLYQRMGWTVVGQTIDPEATLAREAGAHYAAIAVTIDDREVRSRFLQNDPSARGEIDSNIATGRQKTFTLFLEALPKINGLVELKCNCTAQGQHVRTRSKHFYYCPAYLCTEEGETQ